MRRVLISVAAALACAGAWAGPAPAKDTSDPHLVSELTVIRPETSGLELAVVDRDQYLRLVNKTDGTVVVIGYDKEPYLRFQANGRVDANSRSPSKYVNEDRFGRRPVPATANSSAPPRWQQVSSDGSYRWFDHRIHYMAPGVPEEVKDTSRVTKIFDWSVPMQANGKPVRALGTLNWQPEQDDSGSSVVPFIVGGLAVVAVVLALALLLRRRRKSAPAAASQPGKQAW